MKWKVIGDILVVDKNLPELNMGKNGLETLANEFKVKSIVKINKIQGQMREPEIELLYGDSTETIHKENMCLFKLDLAKVMWSKGNTQERIRIAKLVKPNETVLDMFAGIGYFTIPIAKHGKVKKLTAIEINPNSFKYLKENLILNKVENNVVPLLGDCDELAKNIKADRVIMGYVRTTHHYLDTAINALNDGGILHYHETVPDKLINTRPINRIKEVAKEKEVELLNLRTIKKYSPGVSHVVLDVQINEK